MSIFIAANIGSVGVRTVALLTGVVAVTFEEVSQFPSVFLGGTADLTLAFAGVEAGGLVLEAFYFFGGGDVEIIVDGFGVLYPVVEETGDFYTPAPVFGFYFVFISDGNIFGCFSGISVIFYSSFIAGVGGLGPGLEESDGPEIFVEAEFFFFGHNRWRVFWASGKINKIPGKIALPDEDA